MCPPPPYIVGLLRTKHKQVRSLTLDRWTTPLMELLQRAGNDSANKVWEAYSGTPSFSKIDPDADRSAREAFIRSKYEHRKFLDPPHDTRWVRCGESRLLSCLFSPFFSLFSCLLMSCLFFFF